MTHSIVALMAETYIEVCIEHDIAREEGNTQACERLETVIRDIEFAHPDAVAAVEDCLRAGAS